MAVNAFITFESISVGSCPKHSNSGFLFGVENVTTIGSASGGAGPQDRVQRVHHQEDVGPVVPCVLQELLCGRTLQNCHRFDA